MQTVNKEVFLCRSDLRIVASLLLLRVEFVAWVAARYSPLLLRH